jgi:protease-4
MRVDSPGGSYVASDVIRREVELTRKAKPLIVSMGNVAASGGYFVSMDAGKIFADSGTITGSIGVFGGKLVTHGMWEEKLGINWSGIHTGDNADFWSTQTEYSAKGWERMNAWLDRIYADFTTKAAKGRGMQVTELEPLAHGRVWSGKDALERKLIDRIGGLADAVDEARQQAGVAADARYSIIILPETPGLLRSFFSRDETFALPPEARQALRALALVSPQGDERLLLDPTIPQLH